MPLFDFICKKCGKDNTLMMDIPSYEKWIEGECEHCKEKFTKKERDIGRGIKGRVIGVSKGNYNGLDFS